MMKATNSPTKKKRKKKKEVFPSVWFLASAFLLVWFLGNAFCFCLISVLSDPPSRSCLCSLFIAAALICSNQQCRLPGTEALPEGIVSKTSNLEMRPLWSSPSKLNNQRPPMNLLAIAAGIKQKKIVDQIVRKFPSKDFVVMLFHYDGVVDEWKDLVWADRAIHVSAANQTKWWFAKRFLHPDIVAEYNYIFLWDEDIGVENFNPRRYLSIVKDEGLEISQPALDPVKSEVHHPITARRRNSKAHRRMYKYKGSGRCDDYSTAPPCIGWVEMMAPVFSRAAWRCAWYMIQNDLIHAWGLDIQLGYCAQGDRTKNVGVVDSEYIVHLGLPTLGILQILLFPCTCMNLHTYKFSVCFYSKLSL
ncbi:pentatricopeptide repeat-containing protein [Citrus sinensis]|uniref:Pentatricopeptide repeat-containing protein n=1 Tax=Citrus sinensis TaxID=2711 RepID=A0ACB8K831_CITSI|nr:pentatricopeptide repeat-containing protein [Citrus sinensis]